jgi:hypothetical protein
VDETDGDVDETDVDAVGPPDDQNVGLASAPMFSPRTNECWAPDDLKPVPDGLKRPPG